MSPPAVTSVPTTEDGGAAARSASLPNIHVLLEDPRLAKVRDLERAKDWTGAARAVHDARVENLAPGEACAWDYLEGRYALAAGDGLAAEAAFARAEADVCPLAGYAHLRAAQALGRAGHADEAIARARRVPEDLACSDEVKLVLAESLAAKGDRVSSLPLWRAWLAKNPRGSRWVDTTVRIANALLDGVDGPAESRAKEAFELATKIVVEAPKLAESAGAVAARGRAVALLRGKDASVTEALSDDGRARQAQAWLDNGEATKSFDLASAVLGAAKTGPSACRAAVTRANAAGKLKGSKGDVWGDAIAACEKDEQLANALYTGAKARAGKDPKIAIEWFARLEQLFPTHRLADDARYRGALLVAQSTEEGHDERAEQMLRTLPDSYPAGDMRTEALFRVALGKVQHADWAGAKPLLDRVLELAPDDRHWATAGRAGYFRARASGATGDADDEKKRLVAIVQDHPLAYYMLLAYARLAAVDPALAQKTMKDASARDEGSVFPSRPLPMLESPGVLRGVRLLEVGEVDAARREFAAAGAIGDDADPEMVWAIGAIYNRAGLPELGHAFSRGKPGEHLAHYPEGKWRLAWEVAYPRAFEANVVKSCADNALPTSLAWGIMREESSFVADVKSHSNAFGLMQLIVPTAKWVATGTTFGSDETALKTPEVSIGLGTRLLTKLRAKHVHPALAIGAYNAGSGAVDRWITARGSEDLDVFVELIPYDETRNYIKRVLSSQAAYAYLYDPTTLKEPLGLPFRFAR
ncbi:Soluble lytic murein transglycosylase precursor [Labilithrix luteola]|uniref:Soluble lytic murein transglycosylase n=1 Tax=Labilithrix luteola TaxID=1391654 RepID=A0A0K1QG96_9BACT|nr:Soluble lytic murein transglycosylase precursor [Labilithrix luteola]